MPSSNERPQKLFAPEAIALLVPPQYAAAALPALWLAFAAVAQGGYLVVGLGIRTRKRLETLQNAGTDMGGVKEQYPRPGFGCTILSRPAGTPPAPPLLFPISVIFAVGEWISHRSQSS